MLAVIAASVLAASAGPDSGKLAKLTGGKPAAGAGNDAVTIDLPRSDLDVYVGKVHLLPAQGLVARATFQKLKSGTRVAGEMVLLDDQVGPAMAAALDGHLEVTSLDRHFLHESPRLTYLRVQGTGDEAALGASIGKLFEVVRSKTSSAPHLAEVDLMGGSHLDASALSAASGGGKLEGEVFLSEKTRAVHVHGEALSPGMGADSWIAIAGPGDAASASGAVIAGVGEVNGVMSALHAGGLETAALEPLPNDSAPELRRVYFFGTGPAVGLAKAYRAALDQAK